MSNFWRLTGLFFPPLSSLILSLDPDSDPLCMLLVIDFLMLRSREYDALLQLYEDWEVNCASHCTFSLYVWFYLVNYSVLEHNCLSVSQEHRNLSQLPNFAFSTALCYFHLSQEEEIKPEERDQAKHKADQMLADALIMFPAGKKSYVAEAAEKGCTRRWIFKNCSIN